MTVIDTSTSSTATAYGSQRKSDRCQNGVLWKVHIVQAVADGLRFAYSTDDGATWTTGSNASYTSAASNYVANASFFIDPDDYAHLVYKDQADGKIYYRRGTPNAGRTAWTWSAAQAIWDANALADYPDVVAHREGTGWKVHVVHSYQSGGGELYARYRDVAISSGGTFTIGSNISLWGGVFGPTVHTFPSIDFNHTGDGKTVAGSTPHLYVAWSAGTTGGGFGIRFKKATYSGGSWTWGTEREIDSTRYVDAGGFRWLNCLFDGTRVAIVGFVYDGTSADVVLHDRDAADTTTTPRTLVENATPSQILNYGSATYDGDGNVYFFGIPNDEAAGSNDLVYRRWVRATNMFESEVVVDSAGGSFVSAKRGYSEGLIEFIYTDGTASPYNIVYESISLNVAPNAPTLTFPINSEIFDRATSQQFTWTFNDPDSGDLQSAYELRYRLVGAPSWTTVSGGATQSHTFAGGTFAAGDYEWQVRTTDNGGLVGPWSSSQLFTAATAPATPAIYDPVNNGTVNSNPYPIRWTASSQDAFQVRTLNDNAGSPGTIIETSLVIEQASRREWSMAFNTNNVVQHVQVRVRVNGLWSSWNSVKVNVAYTESQPGTLILTEEPDLGRVKVQFIPPTPVGTEPLIVSNDLTRKINGTIEYIAIARGLGQSFTYYDYNVSGGIAWEYQVMSYADNDTMVYSVPQVITPFQLKGSWIHFADDGPNTAIQFIYNDNAGDEDYEIQKSLFHTAGENEPFVEFGEGHSHSLTVRFFIDSEQIPYFKILMRSGKILCYRDFYGRKVFCVPEASPIQRTFDGGWSTVKFTEVFYEEAM